MRRSRGADRTNPLTTLHSRLRPCLRHLTTDPCGFTSIAVSGPLDGREHLEDWVVLEPHKWPWLSDVRPTIYVALFRVTADTPFSLYLDTRLQLGSVPVEVQLDRHIPEVIPEDFLLVAVSDLLRSLAASIDRTRAVLMLEAQRCADHSVAVRGILGET